MVGQDLSLQLPPASSPKAHPVGGLEITSWVQLLPLTQR